MLKPLSVTLCLGLLSLFLGLSSGLFSSEHFEVETKNVVFWLSVDGVKGDYLNRVDTPFLDELKESSYHTTKLVPTFPSLTFPVHASQVTGVGVREHGVPSNVFYDIETETRHAWPDESSLLQSDPIWKRVKRQGLRSAVFGWVLSHRQRGPYAADYFDETYRRDLNDRERLERISQIWKKDTKENPDNPLRIVMGYLSGPDNAGHRHGPSSPQVDEKIVELDANLAYAISELKEVAKLYPPHYQFYFFMTTDHGMVDVEYCVNIRHLSAVGEREGVQFANSGNTGHIYLDRIETEQERAEIIALVKNNVAKYDFATAYTRDEIPKRWQFDHPHRVGDIFLVIESGYNFNARPTGVFAPIDEVGGTRGMHGYDPHSEEKMLGFGLFWRYPKTFEASAVKLEKAVHSLELKPTIMELLELEQADNAQMGPIKKLVR